MMSGNPSASLQWQCKIASWEAGTPSTRARFHTAFNLLIRTMETLYGMSRTTQQIESLSDSARRGSERKEGAMRRGLAVLLAEDGGQDLAEYGIALAVISILAGVAAVVIAKDVGTLWSQAQSVIVSATTSATS